MSFGVHFIEMSQEQQMFTKVKLKVVMFKYFFNFRGFQVPFEFPAHNLGEMIQFKKHMVEMVHLVGESSKMEIRKTYFQGSLGLRYIPVK